MEIVFDVEHMTCADCAERLEVCMSRDASVASAHVALMAGTARIKLVDGEGEEVLPRLANYGTALGFGMRLRAQGTVLRIDATALTPGSEATELGVLAEDARGIEGVTRALPSKRPCRAAATSAAAAIGSGKLVAGLLEIAYDTASVGARHILGVLVERDQAHRRLKQLLRQQ